MNQEQALKALQEIFAIKPKYLKIIAKENCVETKKRKIHEMYIHEFRMSFVVNNKEYQDEAFDELKIYKEAILCKMNLEDYGQILVEAMESVVQELIDMKSRK